jgi:hypothetical protein
MDVQTDRDDKVNSRSLFAVFERAFKSTLTYLYLFAGAGGQQQTVNGSLTQGTPCDGHVAGEHSETHVSGTITRVQFVDNLDKSVLIYTAV